MTTKAGGASSLVTSSIRSRLQLNELDRDNFFEVAYEHFAEAGVWELYPEVPEVLEQLRPRFQLAVISNFDGRLRFILQHLGISKYFSHIFISSELGADKPDPEIFRRALKLMHLNANEVLHVGDDPERDWKAAEAGWLVGFSIGSAKKFAARFADDSEAVGQAHRLPNSWLAGGAPALQCCD